MKLRGILSRTFGGALIGWLFGKFIVPVAPTLAIIIIIIVTVGFMIWMTQTMWDLNCRYYHLMSGLHAVIPDDDFFMVPPRPRLYNVWLKYCNRREPRR